MHSYLTDLRQGAAAICAIPAWRVQQGLVILAEALMSFLALFLLETGLAQTEVLAIFALVYGGCGVCVRIQRTALLPASLSGLLPAGLGVLALGGVAAALVSPQPATLALAAFGTMTLKDLVTTGAVSDVHRAAERLGLAPTRLVSTGMLVGALLMIVVLTGSGRLLSVAPSLWLLLIAGACAALLVLILRRSVEIKTPAASPHLPRNIRLICTLSLLYNAVSFAGKRFIVPLAVATMARDLNLGADAYAMLGTLLSLLVLLGLSLRSISNGRFAPRSMMFSGFFTGLALWGVLAHLVAAPSLTWTTALTALVCLLLVEITAKIWTLGFIETLRLEARSSSRPEADLAYYGYFMELKGYGAGMGFLVALAGILSGLPALAPTVVLGLALGALICIRTGSSRAPVTS